MGCDGDVEVFDDGTAPLELRLHRPKLHADVVAPRDARNDGEDLFELRRESVASFRAREAFNTVRDFGENRLWDADFGWRHAPQVKRDFGGAFHQRRDRIRIEHVSDHRSSGFFERRRPATARMVASTSRLSSSLAFCASVSKKPGGQPWLSPMSRSIAFTMRLFLL